MIIIGAGISGLIAGHYFSKHSPVIYERQPSLPNNHDALLRFRTNKVAQVTGVDFKRVQVRKDIYSRGDFKPCNPRLANMYSRKVTDAVLPRSIWDGEVCERYIAPGDFISQSANGLSIKYSSAVTELVKDRPREPVISTVPMPVMMKIAGWPDVPKFSWKPIWSITAEIAEPYCDVYQTIHYPDFDLPYYRASITGKKLIIECAEDPLMVYNFIIKDVTEHFGISPCAFDVEPRVKRQEYGKIVSTDPDICRDFMYTLTQEYGIYSLGRFATWRQILLDDVVQDCEVIERLIKSEARRSSYHESLASTKVPEPH